LATRNPERFFQAFSITPRFFGSGNSNHVPKRQDWGCACRQAVGPELCLATIVDITERKPAERERERLLLERQDVLKKVRTLSGLLPICSQCKKIRGDHGYWSQAETCVMHHSDAQFTHGLCPECITVLFPDDA
jgi:hypothetical protein